MRSSKSRSRRAWLEAFAGLLSIALLPAGGPVGAARAARGSAPRPPSKTALTVSAAISLKDALDEVKQVYVSANPGVSLAMNYGASGTLQIQIEQGAPVDIFLSA